MPDRYSYSALPSPTWTRLLRLKPGSAGQSLQCSLDPVSLENMPEYEALSYVWGDPSKRLPILIDGCSWDITVNLHDALNRLRHDDRDRLLWVDALCINQGDRDEVQNQIGNMHMIYTKISQVVVWLGKDSGRYECRHSIALEFCQTLEILSEPWQVIDPRSGEEVTIVASQLTFGEDFDDCWEACRLLFNRPWWSRVWILQEVIHDRPVLVYIGQCTTISLEDLCSALQAYRNNLRTKETTSSGQNIPSEPGKLNFEPWLRTSDVEDVPDVMATLRVRAKGLAAPDFETSVEYPPRLASLVRRFREQQATMAKDKLYGLRGMATNREDLPMNWHNLPVEKLYLRIMRVFLKNVLFSLLWVESPARRIKANAELPSWVPDFRTKQDFLAKSLFSICTSFNSDAGFPTVDEEPRVDDDIDSVVLTLRGMCVGQVTETFRTNMDSGSPKDPRLEVTLMKWSDEQADFRQSTKPLGSSNDVNDIPKALPQGMSFANTSWCPTHTRPGDVIIVTPGSKIPLVLRRHSSTEYLLVGGCVLIQAEIEGIRYLTEQSGFSRIMFGSACKAIDRNQVEIFRIV